MPQNTSDKVIRRVTKAVIRCSARGFLVTGIPTRMRPATVRRTIRNEWKENARNSPLGTALCQVR